MDRYNRNKVRWKSLKLNVVKSLSWFIIRVRYIMSVEDYLCFESDEVVV